MLARYRSVDQTGFGAPQTLLAGAAGMDGGKSGGSDTFRSVELGVEGGKGIPLAITDNHPILPLVQMEGIYLIVPDHLFIAAIPVTLQDPILVAIDPNGAVIIGFKFRSREAVRAITPCIQESREDELVVIVTEDFRI